MSKAYFGAQVVVGAWKIIFSQELATTLNTIIKLKLAEQNSCFGQTALVNPILFKDFAFKLQPREVAVQSSYPQFFADFSLEPK